MFRKILVAVDGSLYADTAIEYSADLSKKYGSKVVLVHAVVSPALAYEGVVIAPTDKMLRDEGQKILERGKELASRHGVDVETRMVFGHAADAISKVANEEEFDLLIVGSRGLSKVKALLLGSVSEGLSRLVKCPILIVKAPSERRP